MLLHRKPWEFCSDCQEAEEKEREGGQSPQEAGREEVPGWRTWSTLPELSSEEYRQFQMQAKFISRTH
jgi:hypothetical protein